jgi:hypothetical protein
MKRIIKIEDRELGNISAFTASRPFDKRPSGDQKKAENEKAGHQHISQDPYIGIFLREKKIQQKKTDDDDKTDDGEDLARDADPIAEIAGLFIFRRGHAHL